MKRRRGERAAESQAARQHASTRVPSSRPGRPLHVYPGSWWKETRRRVDKSTAQDEKPRKGVLGLAFQRGHSGCALLPRNGTTQGCPKKSIHPHRRFLLMGGQKSALRSAENLQGLLEPFDFCSPAIGPLRIGLGLGDAHVLELLEVLEHSIQLGLGSRPLRRRLGYGLV